MTWSVSLSATDHASGLTVDASSSGSVVGVWGPNGAGKTSLLLAILGLLPSDGTVRLGQTWVQQSRDRPRTAERNLGAVFQDLRLFPHMTVRQNLEFGSRGLPISDVVERLELDGLMDRRPRTLSGGERQRVALGRALACRPRALLLDEPLSAVDQGRRRVLLPWLAQILRAHEIPALVVSHDLGELRALTDELWVMDRGRVVAHGPFEETLGQRAVLELSDRLAVSNVLCVQEIQATSDGVEGRVGDQRVVLPSDPPGSALQTGQAWIQVRPSDLILAREDVGPTSARNIFRGTVVEVLEAPGGCVVRLDLGAAVLSASVTRSAVQELRLENGTRLRILVKTTALRW